MAAPLDPARTAVLLVDPQNDFLSEGGALWDLVGPRVRQGRVVEHLAMLRQAAEQAGMPVFYSPHYYTEEEMRAWKHLNPVDRMMFARRMFRAGSWGAGFHPDLQPDDNTVVLAPHKGLSNFHTGDTNLQLRQRGIQTIILGGMSANLCVESHLRDAVEHGFDVIAVEDATTGISDDAVRAAATNYALIASDVVSTDEALRRMRRAEHAAPEPR